MIRITDALLGEHGVFYAQFDYLEDLVRHPVESGQLQHAAALLAAGLIPHARLENELLFDTLEPRLGPPGMPLPVMREEHESIEAGLLLAQRSRDPLEVAQLIETAIAAARDHFAKEEEVLFPLAEQTLEESVLYELGREWARRRAVRLAAGVR